jgi:hypothetical protein
MAVKTFYVTRDMRHPLYRNRMLRAGEPLELSGPDASLYKRLGAISDEKPQAKAEARKAETPAPKPEAPKPAAKAAPKRTRKTTTTRTTKRKTKK